MIFFIFYLIKLFIYRERRSKQPKINIRKLEAKPIKYSEQMKKKKNLSLTIRLQLKQNSVFFLQ
jgi:hypothetical protein